MIKREESLQYDVWKKPVTAREYSCNGESVINVSEKKRERERTGGLERKNMKERERHRGKKRLRFKRAC